nr:MAG TPA: hypothetical protein [Caudoviricetes sp.]
MGTFPACVLCSWWWSCVSWWPMVLVKTFTSW